MHIIPFFLSSLYIHHDTHTVRKTLLKRFIGFEELLEVVVPYVEDAVDAIIIALPLVKLPDMMLVEAVTVICALQVDKGVPLARSIRAFCKGSRFDVSFVDLVSSHQTNDYCSTRACILNTILKDE